MIKRREFLKGLAVATAAALLPVETNTGLYSAFPQTEAQEHFKGFELGKDIELTELGVEDRKSYSILRYQLRKRSIGGNDLVAYCEIDNALVEIVPDPQSFIKQELKAFVEAMRQEAKNRGRSKVKWRKFSDDVGHLPERELV